MCRHLMIALGALLTAIGDAVFMVPCKIISGSITSLALILSDVSGFDISYFVVIIRLVLLFLCAIFLGRIYLEGSLFCVVAYLVSFLGLHHIISIYFFQTHMSLWFAVPIGAIFVGIGYGFCIAWQATEVSFDILALIVHQKIKAISVPTAMYGINFLVLFWGYFLYSWQVVAAGVVFSLINAYAMHFVLLHLIQEQED